MSNNLNTPATPSVEHAPGDVATEAVDFLAALDAERARRAEPFRFKTLPGVTALLCRPQMDVYLMAGELPEAFLRLVLKSAQGGLKKADAERAVADMPEEDFRQTLFFMRDLVCDAFVTPKVVPLVKDPKTEISIKSFRRETLMEVFLWALAGSPGVPVETEGGGTTSIDAISKSGGESELPGVGEGVSPVSGDGDAGTSAPGS